MDPSRNGPIVSVVVPNFNSGPVLRRALQSILNQTYSRYQLIVVDSLSTDETPAIIDEYLDRIDVCIREKDTGHANALNKGFARANGDIYCYLCADDELKPHAFETVVRLLEQNPDIDLAVGGCERVYSDGTRELTTPPPDALEVIGYIDLIEQPSTFWRASLHRKVAPLEETEYFFIFDWDLWCRMKQAGARPSMIPDPLSLYYFSSDNKTSRAGLRFAQEARRLLRRYGPLGGRLGDIYWLLFRHLDLHGCYDHPPTCSWLRGKIYGLSMLVLRHTIGRKLAHAYNWNFASKQARGLKWW